ncbi:thiamine pyrophosphate-dependent enzyme [Ilumatobacter nonamiensis]|uniref:thiamine pyrophosphate-dependent enzyme n=1 Tax=Ilumatobacter nonamiensis TaxID=467093 RepID=UPI0003470389|nr:thiamine pyrophosphate-dependent enzyme [Ilumatobacter nonamiensis]
MSKQSISQVVVDGLVAHGVSQVFGVVGDALNSVTEAIRTTEGIEWIGVRHEEVGAFAAGAQAQITGQIGVCAGTVGPGSLHLLNGLYDAAKSHAPVLAIAGQVPVAELRSNYFQEVDNDAVFDDVAVFTATVTSPDQIPRLVEQAIESAVSRRGVAVLSIPGDIGPMEVDTAPVRVFQGTSRARPDEAAVARAAALLDAADKVTILAGIGSREGRTQVLELAGALAAPIVSTLKAKEIYDWDNPFDLGQNGLIGNPAAADAFRDCDLLLMIGTDFPYREWFSDDVTTIQIDAAADHIGRRTTVDLGIVGDAALTLDALLPRLRGEHDRDHLENLRDSYQEWCDRQTRLTDPTHDETFTGSARAVLDNPEGRIRPEAVAHVIGELADDDAVFTTDTGMSTVWLSRFVRMRSGQRLLGSFNLGSMANAMPQAIGVQALDRSRQVIAFAGDGGFTMLLGDLLTAVSESLPVKIFVFDNQRLGMVKLEQEEAGLPDFGTTLKNPDLAAVATAMGATGIRIEDPADLRDGIERALAHDGPVVVDVLTNPDEIIIPSEPSPGQAWGFTIAKIKEAIRSVGDD